MKYYVVELVGYYKGINPSLDWKSIYYSNIFHRRKKDALEELEEAKKVVKEYGYDIAIIREVER